MWVVYFSATYEGEWGHTYFRNEDNAKEYYERAKKGSGSVRVNIEEVETED